MDSAKLNKEVEAVTKADKKLVAALLEALEIIEEAAPEEMKNALEKIQSVLEDS